MRPTWVVRGLAGCLSLVLSYAAHAQVNSWINAGSGKWEVTPNWAFGTPNQYEWIYITNANFKIVSLDSTTATYQSSLTISNLTLAGASGATNTMSVNLGSSSPPLEILNGMTLGTGGVVLLTNSTIQIDSDAGQGLAIDGNVWVNGGQLTATNAFTVLGNTGAGQLTVSNGTVLLGHVLFGTNSFTTGTMTVAGGNLVASNMFVGQASSSTGAIWVTGGNLIITNVAPSGTIIGASGTGQFTLSNGTVQTYTLLTGFRNAGTVTIAGGTLSVNLFEFGFYSGSTGVLWVTGGELISTNGGIVEAGGVTQMAVSNGTCLLRDLYVAQAIGSLGTFTLAGGTINCGAALSSNILIASLINSTGAVWITGGQLIATNSGETMYVGREGVGQMAVSNGSVSVRSTVVGWLDTGTLTLAGGSFSGSGPMTVGFVNTGTVWIAGGQLLMPNATLTNASSGVGTVVVSNGTAVVNDFVVAGLSNSVGTLTVAGGSVTAFADLIVGDCGSNAVGEVQLTGGAVFVTNASHTAFVDVRDGTFTVSGGTLMADEVVVTNSCGRFLHNGGTMIITSTNLSPNLSAVGDGIPNGWKQQYNLNPFDPNLADEDLNGTGFTVLQDYLAGVDPTKPAAAFRITSVTPQGTSLHVTWTMGPNRTNALQATAGAANGSYNTNAFVDIFSVTNTVGTVTNFLDTGALTNVPSRYYRVRIVP